MTFENAKASNWVMEGFSVIPTGFRLNGTDKGYTSFGRAFTDGDTVFYSATDEQGNREAGFGTYQANTIIDRKPTATLFNNVYNGTAPSPLPFSNGGTIAGTFNAVAFNTLWDHLYNTDNPHEVSAPQVHLEPALTPLDDQNVQSALEFLFGYFQEAAPDDWHLSHIDGNITYIQINSGDFNEFPPSVENLSFAELKLNHDHGHLWTRLADGSIVKIGSQHFIEDGPHDGHVYGRKDGEWFQVSVVEVADDRPTDPSVGDLWCDTGRTMELYVYVNDSQGWVSMTGKGGIDSVIGDNIVLDDADPTMRNIALCREIDSEGHGLWRPIYTTDIETEGAQPMLGINPEITSIEQIHNQKDANWYLFGSQLNGDADLQRQINDINVELEALATTREWGQWTMVATVPEVTAGKIHIDPLNFATDEPVLHISAVDMSDTTHGFTEVVEGDHIELVGPEGFGLYTAGGPFEDDEGSKKFELKLIRSNGVVAVDDVIDVKVFHLSDTDIDLSDLDERYAKKEAERLNISHQTEIPGWYNRPHKIYFSNVPTETWTGSYERIVSTEDGAICFTTRGPTSSGNITAKTWADLQGYANNDNTLYLRRTHKDLAGNAVGLFDSSTSDGSVIVLKQEKTGAELVVHVQRVYSKTAESQTETAVWVDVRRASGAASDGDPWKVYQQREYLSAKGHDHYIGTLNTRENRTLKKWKSLASTEFSISENTGTPVNGDGCYSWNRANWFKIYGGEFGKSVISGDYPNGLGIATIQKNNTIYAGYLTTSECQSMNSDHTWRVQSFMGRYENSTVTEWDTTFTVATNGLIQNTKTRYKNNVNTNVFTLGSEDEDIENPERPIWTGDNFGDFKSLEEFVAELKSADPEGDSIDFLVSQWQTYWYTPGR